MPVSGFTAVDLGYQKGDYHIINPNDHVNFGQSTNDVYPTAFRLALILRVRPQRHHRNPALQISLNQSRQEAIQPAVMWRRAGAPRH